MIIYEKMKYKDLVDVVDWKTNPEYQERYEKYHSDKIQLYSDFIFNAYLAFFLDEDVTITSPVENQEYDDFVNLNKQSIMDAFMDYLALGTYFMTYGFNNGKMTFKKLDPRFTRVVYLADEETNEVVPYAYFNKVTRNELIDGKAWCDVEYVHCYAKEGLYVFKLGETQKDGKKIKSPRKTKLVKQYPYIISNKKEKKFEWDNIPVISADNCDFFDKIYPFMKEILDIQTTAGKLYNELPDSILVLKNYSGTDLDEAKEEIKEKRMAKVEGDGDMKAVILPTEAESYEAFITDITKRFFKLIGMPDVDNFGNASGISLKYIYKQLAIAANFLEPKLEECIKAMLHAYQDFYKQKNYEDVTIIFNTTIIESDQEKIDNINNSRGLIDDETLIKIHPYYKPEYFTNNNNNGEYSPNMDIGNTQTAGKEDDLDELRRVTATNS